MALMDLLKDLENTLGWDPGRNPWKARAAQHHILSTQMRKRGISESDLRLAMAWCQRRKQQILTPAELFRYVEPAKDHAAGPTQTLPAAMEQLEMQMHEAIAAELNRDDEHSDRWLSRLVRASGPGRGAVLADWREAGRG